MAGNYQKEKVRTISTTDQEIDAWEALRREPGLIGRLARRGKRMKPSYVGGLRSFDKEERSAQEKSESRSTMDKISERAGATLRNAEAALGGGRRSHEGWGLGYQGGSGGGGGGTAGMSGSGGGGGGQSGASRAELDAANRRASQAEKEMKDYKAGEEGRKKEAIEGYQGERRQQLTDEFGGYKGDYKDLRGRADYSEDRGQLDTLRTGARDKFGGYESDISGMADRGGQVAGIGGQVGTAAGQMGTMAEDAMDTQKLMKDRGLFAGQLEAQRKAQQGGTMANLRRSMASAGASPQEIARAEAEASKGGAQQGRADALQASMSAMQAGQSQLGQAAQFRGMQAGMLGQAQNLGLQKTQAAAGMYGQGLAAQQGLIGQRQGMLQSEIAQQAGLTGQMAGMTGAQLQDIVAQQNMAQEKDLAERGLLAQQQASAAGAPQKPSQFGQLMQTAATVAPIVAAFSDKNLKKNIKKAKDKDLMNPKEIDGFLNDLYAYQYNYKDSNHGAGKQVGVMAQDLEKTQLGKQMVEDTPEGKQINAAKGLGLAMASQARLNQRLNSIGA